MTDDNLNRLIAAARIVVGASRAYDRAISAVGAQIDADEAPTFVDSDQLDTLYLAWLDAIDALARLVEVSDDRR